MQNTTKRQIIEYTFVAVVLLGSFIFLFVDKPKGIVYDCSISEISPDYPPEVKEQCRKLRANNIQEDLKKPK